MSMARLTDKRMLLLVKLLVFFCSSSAAVRPQAGERAPPLQLQAPGHPHASVIPGPAAASNPVLLPTSTPAPSGLHQHALPQPHSAQMQPKLEHERIQQATAPAALTNMFGTTMLTAPTGPVTKAPINSTSDIPRFKYPVWWFAPFWSGTGYSSEAINYVLSMVRSGSVHPSDLWVTQHGDNERKVVRASMQQHDSRMLTALEHHVDRTRPAIVVCHSLPTNWMLPSPMGWAGAKCPPDPREYPYVYLIGRTMFETDRLPGSFVARCNAMNEVWVPSNFSKEVFIASGVVPSKLHVVPEGINTTYFDPARYTAMPMPQGELVFGPHPASPYTSNATISNSPSRPFPYSPAGQASSGHRQVGSPGGVDSKAGALLVPGKPIDEPDTTHSPGGTFSADGLGHRTAEFKADGQLSLRIEKRVANSGGKGQPSHESDEEDVAWKEQVDIGVGKSSSERPFRFLSTFKWEARKGWDVLLEAYLTEFTAQDNVELTIITKPFMGKSNFKQQMHTWAERTARAQYNTQHAATLKRIQELQARLQQEMQQEQASKDLSKDPGAGAATTGLIALHTQHAQHELITLQHPQDLSQVRVRSIVDPELYATDSKQPSIQVTSNNDWNAVHAAASQQGHASMQVQAQAAKDPQGEGQKQAAGTASTESGLHLPEIPPPFVFDPSQLPRLYVVHEHIPDKALPRFYKAVDAFVLPSRGEGWGRPHVEAMAMGLPVISTNWSGITAYLDESVGYPLQVEGLVPADPAVWWFRGLRWAQPSVNHLKQLMRAVYSNRTEAARRGAAARRRMVEHFGPDAIGRLVADELRRVDALIPQ